jgi:hypothetical protein
MPNRKRVTGLTTCVAVLALSSACARPYANPRVPRPIIAGADSGANGLLVPPFGRLVDRRSKECASCTVQVWIGPYAGEHSVSVKDPPTSPTPIARIINLGKYETVMYELLPGTQTQYDLYVSRDSQTGLAVWEVRATKPASDPRLPLHGLAESCNHDDEPAQVDDADFWDCTPRHRSSDIGALPTTMPFAVARLAAPGANTRRTVLLPGFSPELLTEAPGWFACDGGCCTGSYINVSRY